jgi:hypothetical protein
LKSMVDPAVKGYPTAAVTNPPRLAASHKVSVLISFASR